MIFNRIRMLWHIKHRIKILAALTNNKLIGKLLCWEKGVHKRHSRGRGGLLLVATFG